MEIGDVYHNTVDNGRFSVDVNRISEYHGRLEVSVVETGEVIFRSEVGLSYDALFGPDVADVADWQTTAIDVIDNWIALND